jgi:hypothetical protein
MRRLRLFLAACAAVLASMLVPAGAGAAFGLEALSASPLDTAAGAHSDFRLHVGFSDPAEQVKELTIGLPPGLVGNPNTAALCPLARLNADDCPAAAAVGSVSTATQVWVLKPLVGLPLTVTGTIYNVPPRAGEPARFGIVLRPPLSELGLLPKIVMQSSVRLRASDFGLDTVLAEIPNTSAGLAVDIQAMDIVLNGTAGNPKGAFMRNPTACTAATTRFEARSYANPAQTVVGEASFEPTGCENLPFSPQLSARIGSRGHTADGSAPPLTTVIEQDADEAGLRDATVLLPTGVGASNDALARFCPGEVFAAGGCPDEAVLGSARAASPLLSEPLSGPVVLVAPPVSGQLPVLGLDLRGQLQLQLLGSFVVTAAGPGNQFSGLPDIPISRFELSFEADHLIASTRDLCRGEPLLLHADYAGHNGALHSENAPASVEGCGAGPKPKVVARLSRHRERAPSLHFRATAGEARIASATLRLPSGLRFAGGRSWRRGARAKADGRGLAPNALEHGPRRLTVRAPAAGSNSITGTVGRGALLARRIESRPRLRVTLLDVDGARSQTSVRLRR